MAATSGPAPLMVALAALLLTPRLLLLLLLAAAAAAELAALAAAAVAVRSVDVRGDLKDERREGAHEGTSKVRGEIWLRSSVPFLTPTALPWPLLRSACACERALACAWASVWALTCACACACAACGCGCGCAFACVCAAPLSRSSSSHCSQYKMASRVSVKRRGWHASQPGAESAPCACSSFESASDTVAYSTYK
eukprot:4254111-Pleurochrysis_carterae.AAC.1